MMRFASSDLEQIISGRFGVGERRFRRAAKGGGIGTDAARIFLRRAGPPWFGSHAAEREPRVADRASFDPQGCGGRHPRRRRRRCARGPSDSVDARNARASPAAAGRRSNRRARERCRARAYRRADDEALRAQSRAGRLCLQISTTRRVRPRERRNPTDGGNAGLAPAEHGVQAFSP